MRLLQGLFTGMKRIELKTLANHSPDDTES